jgi:hypothetical protein
MCPTETLIPSLNLSRSRRFIRLKSGCYVANSCNVVELSGIESRRLDFACEAGINKTFVRGRCAPSDNENIRQFAAL